ncbi:MAG: hypothetical protein R2751_14485 [Bacteroidales bacterium]
MPHNTYRAGLVLLALLAFPVLHAQFNTYSPYTRFGLGDLAHDGFGQNLAMGGTGLAIHESNRINYLNPAAFAALDSMSVYFDFGANSFHNQYRTTNMSNSWWNMNLHHVAFASAMGKHMGFSAGVVPYSSIGYNIKQQYDDVATGTALDASNTGDGGIMNFYVGTALKVFDRVSVGVTMNYLLGRLIREQEVTMPTLSQWSAHYTENFDLRKPVFELGIQYTETFGEKFFFTLGATHVLETVIDAQTNSELVNTVYQYNSVGFNDTLIIDPSYLLGQDTIQSTFTLPAKTGVGLALGIPGKLILTGDYYRQDWSGALSGYNYETTAASSLHLGAEFTPDREALRGYHKLMTYRLGAYKSASYLSVNGQQIEDLGITFGLGMPVRSMKSSLNVAFTLGSRGTTEYNLVKENYGIITFNVTLHDLWFRKRIYD